jgi:hypothetical protein
MKNLKTLNELNMTKLVTNDYLIEMARINNQVKFPYDVFVYGGPSYGNRAEHGDPHFHFADKIKGGNYHFSVLIPSTIDWQQNKELYISETSNGDYSWSGLRKEKRELIKWMDESNYFIPSISNIESIRSQWNMLNIDNKNEKDY